MESNLRQHFINEKTVPKLKMGKIETKDFMSILALCKRVEDKNGIGVIMGDAGSGKTFAVNAFMETSSKAVYMLADDTMGNKNFVESLGNAVGVHIYEVSAYKMGNEIINYLHWQPKTIIIDEAEKLMGKNSAVKIEILRRIHDECHDRGTALILAGSLFIESFLKTKNLKENYGQFSSRIDYLYKTQGLFKSDFDLILNMYSIEGAARAKVINMATNKESRGKMRRLTKLLDGCVDIMESDGNDTITSDIVKRAGMFMFEE